MTIATLLSVIALVAVAPPPPAAATATTGPAENVSQTGAILTGSVENAASYRFEYGTTSAYGLQSPERPAEGSASAREAISGLTPNTTYHYRLVATNPSGTTQGADRTFRTVAQPSPPGVSTGGVRDVGPLGARLTATVDPNRASTTVRFEYGTSGNFNRRTPFRGVGSGDGARGFAEGVTGLNPNTRYSYRVVATNAAGTSRGAGRSFVTPRRPTGVSLAVSPRKVTWGGSTTISGRLTGSAVGGAAVALERQGFPFSAGFAQVGRTVSARRDGSYRFTLSGVLVTTRVRVVTRTSVVVASAVATVSSAVRVGARSVALRGRRTRIEGSVWPALPNGRVSLQKRGSRGRWVFLRSARVRPRDANRSRYAFTVRRAGSYRAVVLARDGGAHVPGRSRLVRVR